VTLTSDIDLLAAFAGLGMFLFGMMQLESGIKTAAGARFKTLLRKTTNTLPKSIVTGAIATAVLQSSSLVSLMVLAFVGAGIMALSSGIGVMFGANIGSTGVSWIVALLGFKMDINAFATPLIGVGALGLMLSSNSRKAQATFQLMFGFGLLFFGLEMMKESMEHVADHVDMATFESYGLLAYLLMGALLTAAIQSSAGSIAIFLAALAAGVIDFHTAAVLVIGANVGTTITIMLGSIGGGADKKRVALAHLIFNLATGVVALVMLQPITWVVLEPLGMADNPVLGLAIFHTLFNVMGVLLFSGFIALLAAWLMRRFTRGEKRVSKYLHAVNPQVAEASVEALKNETRHLLKEVMRFTLVLLNVPPKDLFNFKRKTTAIVYSSRGILDINVEEAYGRLKRLEAMILAYATRIGERAPEDEQLLNNALAAAREAIYAAKVIKDIKHNLDEFAVSEDDYMLDHYNQIRLRLCDLYRNLLLSMKPEERDAKALFEQIDAILTALKDEDRNALRTIYKAIKTGDIAQSNAPTFISTNRAVVNASESMIEAAELLFMPLTQPDKDETPQGDKHEDEAQR
jgi:phosphate:Na+ symporter